MKDFCVNNGVIDAGNGFKERETGNDEKDRKKRHRYGGVYTEEVIL